MVLGLSVYISEVWDMGSVRKLKRKKEKQQKKQMGEALKRVQQVADNMPTGCSGCGAPFNSRDASHLDNWMVSVYADTATLLCPECFVKAELQEISARKDQ